MEGVITIFTSRSRFNRRIRPPAVLTVLPVPRLRRSLLMPANHDIRQLAARASRLEQLEEAVCLLRRRYGHHTAPGGPEWRPGPGDSPLLGRLPLSPLLCQPHEREPIEQHLRKMQVHHLGMGGREPALCGAQTVRRPPAPVSASPLPDQVLSVRHCRCHHDASTITVSTCFNRFVECLLCRLFFKCHEVLFLRFYNRVCALISGMELPRGVGRRRPGHPPPFPPSGFVFTFR